MKLPTEMTLVQIAQVLGGRVEGPSDLTVGSVAVSPLAATENDIALVFDEKLVGRIAECKAKALIVTEGVSTDRPRIIVERPMLAVQKILTAFQPKRHHPDKGVHESAVVDDTVELGEGAAIGALVVIGPRTKVGAGSKIFPGTVIGADVVIGENCLIYPRCIISDAVRIGNRVILKQGASIGADGFGYVTERESNLERRLKGNRERSDESNPHLKIPQIGTVIIEDDVEIGSCTTVDRATMGATIIGAGTKIDNLVMIAHNARIGKEVLIIAHSSVAGSATIGDRAILSGHVGVTDHQKVGKDAIVEGYSGVLKDVPEGEVHLGIPACERREHFEKLIHIKRLGKYVDEIKDLKKRMVQLEKALAERQLVKG